MVARKVDEFFHDDHAGAPRTACSRTVRPRVLDPLSAYATTYRYPSPTGKRKGGPSADEVLVWVKTISGLNVEGRASLLNRRLRQADDRR